MGKKTKVGKDRRDKFYKLAKETGYRSRAAFKLIQLNRRFGFLQSSQVCIDLCAAPGGWMQVAKQNMPVSSIVIGVDLFAIKNVPGCLSLVGDITSDKTKKDLEKELKTWKADVVLNDGAPNVGRNWLYDAYQQICLTLSAVKLATQFLRPGGWFVTKVFRSKDYNALVWVLKQLFRKVHATKPSASRKESAEIFVVCQYYRAPDKIDPKLLDPKYVFEELDVESTTDVNILKEKTSKKKKPKVEGYEGTDVRKIVTANEFVASDNALKMLQTITEITFHNGEIANHPRTTNEIKECCKDIKVLGRKDLRDLLKWQKMLRDELYKKDEDEESGKKEEKNEKEEVDSEDEELIRVNKDLEILRNEEKQDARRKRKQKNKERAKLTQKLNLKMVIQGDEGPRDEGDDMIFSLNTVKSKKEMASLIDQPPDMLASSESEEEDENRKRPSKYVKYDLETKGDLYEDYDILNKAKGNHVDSESDLETEGLGLDDDEDEDEEKDSDDETKNSKKVKHPLITDLDHRDKDERRKQKAQLWYEKDAFKNLNIQNDEFTEDYDLDRLVESYRKEGVNVIGADKDKKNEPLGKKAKRRARHAENKENDHDSSSSDDSSTDEEENTEVERKIVGKVGGKDGFEIVAAGEPKKLKKVKLNEEELALGQLMVTSKKMRRDLIDGAWNRYMFNDAHLPDWFVKDEEKTMKKAIPVPDEIVDSYKKNLEDLNVRTLKKVTEAKARKRRQSKKRMEKVKKKAETIMENVDNTNQERIRLLKKLYKKAEEKKKGVTYVVAKKSGASGKKVRRPKEVKGRFKVVDPRLKKDKRGIQAKERRSKKSKKR
uniref:Putative rRNA methyltransferase n=1 Tax=Corethrella appendiculata TaxID=1370023 RepID=U5EYF1_9DIPT